MLTAKLKLDGNQLKAELLGSVDESSDLSIAIGPVPAELEVKCRGLERINSMGVRSWIRYFTSLRTRGVRLRFRECSPAVVSCQNFVTNFMGSAEVESLSIPFTCESCANEFNETIDVSKIVKDDFNLGSRKCPECGGHSELDEDESVYFAFLKNG